MSKKIIIDDVINTLKQKNMFGTILLSNEYVNGRSPLEFQCACGNIFYRNYEYIKRKTNITCTDCSRKRTANIKRNSIDDIIKEIEEMGCKYISGEYKNRCSVLTISCKECNQHFQIKYEYIQRDHCGLCSDCYNQKVSEERRLNIDDVMSYIENQGCEYIFGNYINNKSILGIKCQCGNIYERPYTDFQQGQILCSDCSKKQKIINCTNNIEDVIRFIKDNGAKYISGEYIDNESKLTLRCECGELFERTYANIQRSQKSGKITCNKCSYKRRGDNNRKYAIEDSPYMSFNNIIRAKLLSWSNNIRKLYNYKCPITNQNKNLIVHHLNGFSLIVESVIKKYDESIKSRDNITVIPNIDLANKIIEEVVQEHNDSTGILISSNIHNHFHNIYGRGNNTPEQFDEFLNQFYHLRLSDIQIIPNIKTEQDNNIQIKIA